MNAHQLKLEICDIGRRIYNKGFAAGNDGNISFRLGANEVLCTPTMVSKGFLKPDDLCTCDMEGKQLSGRRKRTSEVLLHLAIMKERPDVKSVVHCHPPHATAFAVAREPIPQCVLPEVEVFLGDVPITKYETPGSQAFADTILPYVKKSNVIILANHGTVSFGETEGKERELLELKTKWGYSDARLAPGMENCDICANDVFRDSWTDNGIERRAFEPPPSMRPGASSPVPQRKPAPSVDQEALIQTITERVMAALQAK